MPLKSCASTDPGSPVSTPAVVVFVRDLSLLAVFAAVSIRRASNETRGLIKITRSRYLADTCRLLRHFV